MSVSFRTKVNSGFLPAFFFLAVISVASYKNTNVLVENAAMVAHTRAVGETIEETVSEMKDLETGQRGFLLTGSDGYLEPYENALKTIDGTIDRLQDLTSDNENQQRRIKNIRKLKDEKIGELKETIALRKEKGLTAAIRVILTGHGKSTMDELRGVANDMKTEEKSLLDIRNEKTARSTRTSMLIIIAGGVLSVLILLGALIMVNLAESERNKASRKLDDQNRVRSGLLKLNENLVGEQSLLSLAKKVIENMANFVNARIGAIYLSDETGLLKWSGGFAYDQETSSSKEFRPGDGLVGQVAAQKSPMSVTDAPENYLKVRSSLGDASPKSIHIFPFLLEGNVKGVAELGMFEPLSETDTEFLKLSREPVAIAINSAQARLRIAKLLEETQTQTEELQTQQEELRAANEELQSKTVELETQQEELKQTNEELEEQRTVLEEQTTRLEESNREIQKARVEVEEKAAEVERASKYKSEFLANMSHELRTPLNSILLLSRSLSENTDKNLSPDQREICQTIHSSGVDLLSLISDILDLSKVEAGKLDVRPDETHVADLAHAMENQFRPQMEVKKLKFSVEISKNLPKTILTDRLRLEQILKNFLSNSLKFTQTGEVRLTFERPSREKNLSKSGLISNSSVAISVKDTGIGIPESKKNKIFEAFEQIDSTTSRKYGGAGLGLTIARKLAQLLGGEIQVESSEGKGSLFVVYLPERLEKETAKPDERHASVQAVQEQEIPIAARQKAHVPIHGIEDDRKKLEKDDRVLLVIEDDPKFAKILLGFCHDRGFKCLLAADGETGLLDAVQYLPSGIILDLRLPGISGMTVLGTLKGNPKTRHIPVHVMSVDEKAPDVLRMGAIGFLSKPTTKEGLEEALRKINEKLSNKSKKVLVIEDRKIERDSIIRLVGNDDVKSVGVESGQEALIQLRSETFDCVILDLKLPDMTGFELLEEIERDEKISRPPVIVYTGRDLSRDEVDRLGRFSQSIVIKGVKSEERLLDEVTLFLHSVESRLSKEKQQILENVRHREEVFTGKSLLIVDDDMRNVFALRSIFAKKGFEILVAKTGKEAIEKLHAFPETDLVLMDIMMPEMDGYEAMRLIRTEKRFEKLPIIALTAKAMESDREKCLEAGASDYLSKPIDFDQLLSLLRVWLTG